MKHDMCIYAKDSAAAVEFYLRAFRATLGYNVPYEEGGYMHAEILCNGEGLIAVSGNDRWDGSKGSRNMQYCVNFGDDNREALEYAYSVLIEDAEEILYPIGKCDWSECMADVVDKFGVRWYIAL